MDRAVEFTRYFVMGSLNKKLEGVLLVTFPAISCFSVVVVKPSCL